MIDHNRTGHDIELLSMMAASHLAALTTQFERLQRTEEALRLIEDAYQEFLLHTSESATVARKKAIYLAAHVLRFALEITPL